MNGGYMAIALVKVGHGGDEPSIGHAFLSYSDACLEKLLSCVMFERNGGVEQSFDGISFIHGWSYVIKDHIMLLSYWNGYR